MKRPSRRLGAALAIAVAVALVAAPVWEMPAAAAGDPFGPGVVTLTSATHDQSKTGTGGAAVLGDRVLFRAGTPATGQELWVTDGTPAGTHLVADIWPGVEDGFPEDLVSFKGRVYFSASDGVHGNELWVSDGTADGTRLFADLVPGEDLSAPAWLTVAGGTLYFAAGNPALGDELWASDGTVAGTRMVLDILDGRSSSRPRGLTAFGDKIVFGATVDGGGAVSKPYISDGTAAGTVRLDPLPMAANAVPLEFVPLGDRLFLSVFTPASGVDLWVSAGAAGDARLVKDINPGGDDTTVQLTAYGDRLLFTARTQAAGLELWTSDGTAGGTQLLRDINPGPLSSTPTDYQVAGGRLWFGADDGEHGRELWATDGTTGGTALVRDLVPGAGGSNQWPLGLVGGRSLWTIDLPETGPEPWVVQPDGGLAPLADVVPGPTGSDPVPLGVLGNTAVLAGTDPAEPTVFAATLQTSGVQAKPKRSYPAKRARAKRVVVKVVVAPAVNDGTVVILRKGRVVGRAEVVDGVAKVRIKKRLGPGRHRFSAVYRGSVWAQASTADTFRVRVRGERS